MNMQHICWFMIKLQKIGINNVLSLSLFNYESKIIYWKNVYVCPSNCLLPILFLLSLTPMCKFLARLNERPELIIAKELKSGLKLQLFLAFHHFNAHPWFYFTCENGRQNVPLVWETNITTLFFPNYIVTAYNILKLLNHERKIKWK